MDIDLIANLFANIGVPCACLVGLALFCWKLLEDYQKTTKERETRLNAQIEKNQEVNERLAKVIEKYSSRLDSIEDNVEDIKTDMVEIKAKL